MGVTFVERWSKAQVYKSGFIRLFIFLNFKKWLAKTTFSTNVGVEEILESYFARFSMFNFFNGMKDFKNIFDQVYRT